jgi:hypothetical protein
MSQACVAGSVPQCAHSSPKAAGAEFERSLRERIAGVVAAWQVQVTFLQSIRRRCQVISPALPVVEVVHIGTPDSLLRSLNATTGVVVYADQAIPRRHGHSRRTAEPNESGTDGHHV